MATVDEGPFWPWGELSPNPQTPAWAPMATGTALADPQVMELLKILTQPEPVERVPVPEQAKPWQYLLGGLADALQLYSLKRSMQGRPGPGGIRVGGGRPTFRPSLVTPTLLGRKREIAAAEQENKRREEAARVAAEKGMARATLPELIRAWHQQSAEQAGKVQKAEAAGVEEAKNLRELQEAAAMAGVPNADTMDRPTVLDALRKVAESKEGLAERKMTAAEDRARRTQEAIADRQQVALEAGLAKQADAERAKGSKRIKRALRTSATSTAPGELRDRLSKVTTLDELNALEAEAQALRDNLIDEEELDISREKDVLEFYNSTVQKAIDARRQALEAAIQEAEAKAVAAKITKEARQKVSGALRPSIGGF